MISEKWEDKNKTKTDYRVMVSSLIVQYVYSYSVQTPESVVQISVGVEHYGRAYLRMMLSALTY